MSFQYKVWNFPTFPISKQLFHVPGASADGGFTSGGARVSFPEPGGFSMLEIQPSLQISEWQFPLSSWLMSKTNGEILRIRLAPTPQIASGQVLRSVEAPWAAESIYNETPWSNERNWSGDIPASFSFNALEGSTVVKIDMSSIGPILQHGHVLGHGFTTYKVDDIEYDETGLATIAVKPPLRKNVNIGDPAYFRPWFTGSIGNVGDFKTTYDAEQNGLIQLNKIILSEVILPQ